MVEHDSRIIGKVTRVLTKGSDVMRDLFDRAGKE
jgi:hypothetical protein